MQPEITSREAYDNFNKEDLVFKTPIGINEEVVRAISKHKGEPDWMLQKRLIGLRVFNELETPKWGPDISELDLNKIYYFMSPNAKSNSEKWEDVPADIRNTYEKLGIPEAERTALAGTGAQYESEVVYHKLKEQWENISVIFLVFD